MDAFTNGNIYIYILLSYTKRILRGGGGEGSDKMRPPPPGTHVASVEITALQSTRDVTPEKYSYEGLLSQHCIDI